MSEFNESTINITNTELSPEMLQKITKKWFEDYYNFHRHYSRNKFIFLSRLKIKLSLIFQTFEKMKSIVKLEKDFSSLHFTDESGVVHFVGNQEDLYKIHDELKRLDKANTIKYALGNIESLKTILKIFLLN